MSSTICVPIGASSFILTSVWLILTNGGVSFSSNSTFDSLKYYKSIQIFLPKIITVTGTLILFSSSSSAVTKNFNESPIFSLSIG